MKILNILETYDDPNDTWDSKKKYTNLPHISQQLIDKARRLPNHKMLGAGVTAYVGTDDNDNFSDVVRLSIKGEPTSVYLTYIYRYLPKELRNNPYLPIVRESKSTRTQTYIKMERLIPFNTPSIISNIDFMKACWDKWFHVPFPRAFDPTHLIAVIGCANILNTVANRGDGREIKDPLLNEALLWINTLKKQLIKIGRYVGTDIHYGNIMWRPNQHGFQLVIVDPLIE